MESNADDGLDEYEDDRDWLMIITIDSYDEYEVEEQPGKDGGLHSYYVGPHSIRIIELIDYPNHLIHSNLVAEF